MKLKYLLIPLSVLIVAGGGAGGYFYLEKAHQDNIAEIQATLTEYETQYQGLTITNAYTVSSDKLYGEEILEEDLLPVTLAEMNNSNLITDPAEIVGKYYKTGITAGTLITCDNIVEYPVTPDERAFDVITTYNPIGLSPNDYVDIRFITPMGEDYIAISHKRVEGIYNNVLKLVMNEYDIMVYNSIVTDQILLQGSVIYATKYLEPSGQEKAIEYYPLSYEVLGNIANNPNINQEIDYLGVSTKRSELLQRYAKYSGDNDLVSQLQSGRMTLRDRIDGGQSDYLTQQEIAEREALEAALYGNTAE